MLCLPRMATLGHARAPAARTRAEAAARARLDLEIRPAVVSCRRTGRLLAIVSNTGGEPLVPGIEIDAGRLRVVHAPLPESLAPGERCEVPVVLRARRPRLLRRESEVLVRVAAVAPGATSSRREVVFVQRRVLAPWFLLLLALVAGGGVAALELHTDRSTVPSLAGAPDAATAEARLQEAGLRLDPRVRSRVTTAARPGQILDQIPDPGSKLERGSTVSLLVALGAARVDVPEVEGRTPAGAAAALAAAGLSAGPVRPAGLPRAAVVGQLPVAGARVPQGTVVTLLVRARPGAGGPGGAPQIDVPPITRRSAGAYAAAVVDTGLVPKVIRAVDAAPQGTLLQTRPAAGVPMRAGGTVRIVVSAGTPQLAFDAGGTVRLFDPGRERDVREAVPPEGRAVEPAWMPDGRNLVYRVGRRLLLVSAGADDRGRTIYEGPETFSAVAPAPQPGDGVLALVRRSGGNGDLCFAQITGAALRPRCIRDRGWDLGRKVTWRRGGRELLVFGVRRGEPGRFGMLRYRSKRPFSLNPEHWHGEMATDTSEAGHGVIGAEYSPSGRNVALVTNAGLPRFQLAVVPLSEIRAPVTDALDVDACEATWRPDGEELAVVGGDAACATPGELFRVRPKGAGKPAPVAARGRHPAYQPLTYAGPGGIG